MITTPIARTVVRIQYRLLRTPLTVLDQQIASRYLADDSPLRVALHQGLRTLDATAEHFLGPEGQPEVKFDQTPEKATDESTDEATDQATDEAGEETPGEAQPAEQVERVAEQLLTDPDQVPVAGELADADEDDKRFMAELRAKNIVAEHEAVHGRE